MTTHTTHFLLNLFTAIVGATVPSVILGNSRGTAVPGLEMPAIGLGTGAYSNNPAVSGFFFTSWFFSARSLNHPTSHPSTKQVGYNGYPECKHCPTKIVPSK